MASGSEREKRLFFGRGLSFEERRPVDASKVMHPNPKMDVLLETIRRRGTILDATLYTFEGSGSVACPQGTNDFIAAQAYRVGIPISTGTDDDAEWKDPDSALDTELDDRIGTRIVQAPVQRADFVDAEGLVALSGQFGNCLAQVAIVVNDLVH
jgi:hypothetical protein